MSVEQGLETSLHLGNHANETLWAAQTLAPPQGATALWELVWPEPKLDRGSLLPSPWKWSFILSPILFLFFFIF